MTGPVLLITLGVLLLLNNLDPQTYSFTRLWPVLLIAIGFGKLSEYGYRRMSEARREERQRSGRDEREERQRSGNDERNESKGEGG